MHSLFKHLKAKKSESLFQNLKPFERLFLIPDKFTVSNFTYEQHFQNLPNWPRTIYDFLREEYESVRFINRWFGIKFYIIAEKFRAIQFSFFADWQPLRAWLLADKSFANRNFVKNNPCLQMLSELTIQYGLYRMYRKYFVSRIKSLSEESIGFGHKTDTGVVHI